MRFYVGPNLNRFEAWDEVLAVYQNLSIILALVGGQV